MNDIFVRQNKEEYLSLLRTFNAVYKKAKAFNFFFFVTSALIPFLINIFFLFFDNETFKSILCFVALSMILVAFFLRKIIIHYIEIGSLIQQHYDLSLFRIGKVSISEQLIIKDYVSKYGDKHFDNEINWYEDYSRYQEEIAILHCQKENVNWTSKSTKRYLVFMTAFALIMIAPTIIGCILFNTSISSVFQFCYNTIPIVSYVFYAIYQSIEENNKFVRIKDYISYIIKLSNKNQSVRDELLALQNMIYGYRKIKRVIPNWLYNMFYKNDSMDEKKAAQIDLPNN